MRYPDACPRFPYLFRWRYLINFHFFFINPNISTLDIFSFIFIANLWPYSLNLIQIKCLHFTHFLNISPLSSWPSCLIELSLMSKLTKYGSLKKHLHSVHLYFEGISQTFSQSSLFQSNYNIIWIPANLYTCKTHDLRYNFLEDTALLWYENILGEHAFGRQMRGWHCFSFPWSPIQIDWMNMKVVYCMKWALFSCKFKLLWGLPHGNTQDWPMLPKHRGLEAVLIVLWCPSQALQRF